MNFNKENINKYGLESLIKAYFLQKKLLSNSTINEFVTNSKGSDKAMRGDFESEEVVIKYLKNHDVPISIKAEEHGRINLGKQQVYTGVLDGIDGSSALADDPSSRCGTILSIATGLKPVYNDFFFTGITEYATDKIVYVENEKISAISFSEGGAFVQESSEFRHNLRGKIISVSIDDPTLYKYAKGVTEGMDKFAEFMNSTFTQPLSKHENKYKLGGQCSSGAMAIDLAEGKVDAVAQIVVKGVYEPPSLYVITKAIGGVAMNRRGEKIDKSYWEGGEREYIGLNEIDAHIFANSEYVAQEILKDINLNLK